MKATAALLVLLVAAARVSATEVTCTGDENVAIPPSTPASDFVINDDGTVTHRITGLTWMRCLYGMTWTGTTCEGEATFKTWQEALASAEAFEFAGHDDWRLPNMKEMQSILEERCNGPAMNTILFPGNQQLGFLTSASDLSNVGSNISSRLLILLDGVVFNQERVVPGMFRLVRGTPR